MAVTNNEYQKMTEKRSPNSPLGRNMLLAFLIGGAICTIGQGILDFYKFLKLDPLDAATATSISLIFLGALFTGLKIYDDLAKYAGAGTLVPITGFANSIVSPALEYKSEGLVLGLSVKMFTIAGPVLVYGISASILYGLILWIIRAII